MASADVLLKVGTEERLAEAGQGGRGVRSKGQGLGQSVLEPITPHQDEKPGVCDG